jgi:hypothetical protein
VIRRRARHLHEDRLFECYLAAQGNGAADPPVADHLADCPACQARLANLASVMNEVRQSADDVTSALFPEERLEAQRSQIARRLEQVGHAAARILSFPIRPESAEDARQTDVVARRWLVASAAAGLLLGVGLTSLYDIEFHHTAVATNAPAVTLPAAQSEPPSAPTAMDDALFLSNVDEAIQGSRNRALEPFQTLTPTYRDISATER